MKQPRFVTGLKLFKLCRLLALAVFFKLVVLATLAVDLGGWTVPVFFSGSEQSAHVAAVPERQLDLPTPAMPILPGSSPETAQHTPLLPLSTARAADETANATTPQDTLTRDSLQQKQEELNRREQDMSRLNQEIDQKIQHLEELEKRVQAMLKEADGVQDKKMRHLVDVYSNMKARQAADVLSTLDETIAVQILAGMRGRQAGEILTFVKADKAARLSEALTRMQLPFQ